MPTNANAYNSRLTDEALEKRFRDTFRSQGGAELVDDLYASGVIVPVVDFTSAAEGSALRADLQVAWDFATGHSSIGNTTTTIVSTPGFWKIDLTATAGTGSGATTSNLAITDGLTSKIIWQFVAQPPNNAFGVDSDKFVVFLRAGDSLTGTSTDSFHKLEVSYRQVATVNGDLVNPTGFTFS